MKEPNSDAAQIPSLPKSRRNLTDLDSLIADSIGKMGTYDKMHRPSGTGHSASDPAQATPNAQTVELTASKSEPQLDPDDETPERFQIVVPRSVIIAAKLEALKKKTTAADITERALRAYLGLDAKD
ncbi:hypothetical protein [Rhizobium jaguaris]|uniref:Uncharacterized protein n=1 Tax=Rhizobium jaguaris TaxID=1312183 RepID=A0A387G943_9HYPH|nr:hypothetical protein [Rhizobium jaguaris]AYG64351.1 hypothetical protein CCGE525_36985 [Rhizobium jaguaris]